MQVAQGREVYRADAHPVLARGYQYTDEEFGSARAGRLRTLLSDAQGRAGLASLYGSLSLTDFGRENVETALREPEQEEHSRGWREGEALGEAWLVDHKSCAFPWPFNRDLRNPRASMAGAELVGFAGNSVEQVRLAFAQVKTSKEAQSPPQVVTKGDTSLIGQVKELRDNEFTTRTLVNYLGYRAALDLSFQEKYKAAATKYFDSGVTAIAIFGVLVRDVAPDKKDLAGAATTLKSGAGVGATIELIGIYLPAGAIPKGPSHKPRKRKANSK